MVDRAKLLKRLREKILVAVEWDGRRGDDPTETYDADSNCGYTYPIDQVEKSVKESIARCQYEDPAESALYEEMKRQTDALGDKVKALRDEIIKRAQKISEVDDLPDDYIESVVQRFIEDNKADCVLVAPDLWLPSIITEH